VASEVEEDPSSRTPAPASVPSPPAGVVRAVARDDVRALVVTAAGAAPSSAFASAARLPAVPPPAAADRPLPRERLRRAGAGVPPFAASVRASCAGAGTSSGASSPGARPPWAPVPAPPPPPRRRRRRGRDPVDVRSDPGDAGVSAAAGPSPDTAVPGASFVMSLKSSSFPVRAGRQGKHADGTERRGPGRPRWAGAPDPGFDRRSVSPRAWAPARPRVDSHGNTSLRLAAPCGAPDPFGERRAACHTTWLRGSMPPPTARAIPGSIPGASTIRPAGAALTLQGYQ
jgi:hypothetical protein